ncbi:hypothetical protein HPB52_007672 [Rhipicephalus sanguineus]|uniref:Secreted protein n=1 Tax=Rhipicephalus sanguineus TaxID=34632 RepID=A0A9D4Q1B6_RHISA|nr:hypothetical protein HPB52_007672 [Rhipicephalus sanguineus]
MGPASCFVVLLGCAALFFSTPVYGHNTGDGADEEKASERLDIVATVNYGLRMSAVLGLLWLLLLRVVPQLAVFSPWFFNGMALTVARSSTDAMLDTVLRWARFAHSVPSCSAAEPLQCLQSLG